MSSESSSNYTDVKGYSLFKCMLFDCDFNGEHYHLCDGLWYKIEKDYLKKLKDNLDGYFIENPMFLDCNLKDEGDYNNFLATNNNWICLDKADISPKAPSKVEPCDLMFMGNNSVIFSHIKISTRSSSLSHLFNQGLNSIELIRVEDKSKEKLKKLIIESKHSKTNEINENIANNNYSIIYGIITAKPNSLKSDVLPIFSRISLMRALRNYKIMGIDCSVVIIKDLYPRTK